MISRHKALQAAEAVRRELPAIPSPVQQAVTLLYRLAEALDGAYDSAGNSFAGDSAITAAVEYIHEHCSCPPSHREHVRHTHWPPPYGENYHRCRMCGRRGLVIGPGAATS